MVSQPNLPNIAVERCLKVKWKRKIQILKVDIQHHSLNYLKADDCSKAVWEGPIVGRTQCHFLETVYISVHF